METTDTLLETVKKLVSTVEDCIHELPKAVVDDVTKLAKSVGTAVPKKTGDPIESVPEEHLP